jgi:hypothetical protein
VTWNVKVRPIVLHLGPSLGQSLPLNSKHTKLQLNGQTEYVEVQFYFLHFTSDNPNDMPIPYALVSIYSRPVHNILVESSNTLWACKHGGDDGLRVVEVTSIAACVSMQPLPHVPSDPEGSTFWFVVEKSGLEDAQLTGFEDAMDNKVVNQGPHSS